MVGALREDEGRALAGGSDVLAQVRQVDRVPDDVGGRGGLVVGEGCVGLEVGVFAGERGRAQLEEAVDVPLLDELFVGVDVDGKVEVVRDGHRDGTGCRARRLEHVEALDDEDVGAIHVDVGVGHDVVGDVRVHRGFCVRVAGLHRGEERDEGRAVVGLGEPLAGDEGAFLQDPVRVEEAVGGHQVHARRGVPAGEQQLEEACDRRLADGDRAGDADDEGG